MTQRATHSAYTKLWDDSMRLHAKVYFVALSTYADASRTRQRAKTGPGQAKMEGEAWEKKLLGVYFVWLRFS